MGTKEERLTKAPLFRIPPPPGKEKGSHWRLGFVGRGRTSALNKPPLVVVVVLVRFGGGEEEGERRLGQSLLVQSRRHFCSPQTTTTMRSFSLPSSLTENLLKAIAAASFWGAKSSTEHIVHTLVSMAAKYEKPVIAWPRGSLQK